MKKTILVVEDFVTIRDYVCETLNQKGYATLGANNGNEAYSILEENSERYGFLIHAASPISFASFIFSGLVSFVKKMTGVVFSFGFDLIFCSNSNPVLSGM